MLMTSFDAIIKGEKCGTDIGLLAEV